MLRRIARRVVAKPLRSIRRFRAGRELARVRSSSVKQVCAIGRAMCGTLACDICAEGMELMSLIERRRSSLLRSIEEIEVIDFGAGDPDSHRTMEEMAGGVRSRKTVSTICSASKPPFWCTFLYKLLRELRPSSCVELGSCVGISAAYQAAALGINEDGSLRTLEGCPEISRMAQETIAEMDLGNTTVITGPFHETLQGVMSDAQPIDYFFNDGHHDRDAVLEYFYDSLPYLAEDAVMVFDDISWSPGMRSAWSIIESYDRVAVSIDLKEIGIALIGSAVNGKRKYMIPLANLARGWSSPACCS
jgi:predicted O-methyltransferase YrrM